MDESASTTIHDTTAPSDDRTSPHPTGTLVSGQVPVTTYVHKPCTRQSVLDVVAVISNPARFSRRYQLFMEFCARMRATPRVRLFTVELQQRARPFATNADLKLRTKHEIWHKENLINVAVTHLPPDWQYVAWIDADLEFQNPRWVDDTLEELQTYSVLQLFSHAIDLGPNGETLQVHTGFAYQYMLGKTWRPAGYGVFWHPGYAWACRKSAYNAMGGLIDFAILGSADYHMALAFIGLVDYSLNHKIHPNYKKLVKIFEQRCEKHIRRNLGAICGTILHHWHGDKKNRQYQSRWEILVSTAFDPLVDIKKDCSALWQLEPEKIALRDKIRRYFRRRNEDSIDINQNYAFTKT